MAFSNPVTKTAARIRGYEPPSWWSLAQLAFGTVFVLALVWSLLSGAGTSPTPPTAGASVPATSAGTPTAGTGGTQSSSPAGTAGGSTVVPSSVPTSSGTSGTSGGTVAMTYADGRAARVPAGAAQVARGYFVALFDASRAADLPLADGVRVPALGSGGTGTVAAVHVSQVSARVVSFVAVADADGPRGPQVGTYVTVTVSLVGDVWTITTAG